MKRRLLLVSNSTLHGGGYLEHCQQQIKHFFGQQVKRILFVPYALHDRDAYTKTARDKLRTLGYEVDSVHEAADPVEAVRKAEGIFIGGGNTFRLLKTLYDSNLVTEIRKRVLQDGVPYMGSSAGSNVATISINTTNDMPIVYPPTFSAIGLVPFNINPHYLDPDPHSRHMGETREQRIVQYHEEPDTPCVLCLREGSMLLVEGNKATLLGSTKARLFQRESDLIHKGPVFIPIEQELLITCLKTETRWNQDAVTTVQELFEEHHKELKVPPDSPELNLIELLWDKLV